MDNKTESIRNKYKEMVLGYYHAGKNIDYFVEDFIDFEKLQSFIGVVESREADFTQQGLNFIKEYYGIENLARMLYEENPRFPGHSVKENIEFLERWTPPVDWVPMRGDAPRAPDPVLRQKAILAQEKWRREQGKSD